MLRNRKIKCVLIDPPSVEVNISSDIGLRETKEKLACAPPLGLAYIAATLRENNGVDVSIIDAKSLNLSHEETRDLVQDAQPDLVGITVFTSQLGSALRTAKEIKEVAPGIKIVLGGPHIHPQHEEIIREKDFIDYCIRLEGEITMVELARAIAERSDLGNVRGLTFRKDGQTVINPDMPFVQDLDSLPFPARDLLPNDVYRGAIGVGERARFTYISASRGCPFNCHFCSVHRFWPKPRRRSVENVIREMEDAYRKYHIEYMKFTDEVFLLNRQWASDFCQKMLETGLNKKITWSCDSRVNLVTEELLKKMKAANCAVIFYGIEFGNQRILDFCGKGTKVGQIYNAIEMTKKAGISPTGNFMFGYPTETRETIEQTIAMAKDLDLDHCSFSIVTPFPGSPLYSYCRDNGLLKTNDWKQYNYFDPGESVIRLENIDDDELMILYKQAKYEYYFRHMSDELAAELAD